MKQLQVKQPQLQQPKITICPSLLACDFLQLREELHSFDHESFKNILFHLDIMDGHFVPQLSFGHPLVEWISKESPFPLDAHFMVSNPDFYISTFKQYNIQCFTFHYETTHHHDRMIQHIKEHYPKVGLAITPSTPISALEDGILSQLDLVLVMTVNPGFGGQRFLPYTLKKVSALKEKQEQLKAKFHIQVDGGVNSSTMKPLYEAGADHFVVGSALFGSQKETLQSLLESL